MRVAFDARSLSSPVLRGWDRYTIGIVRALMRRGVEVTLFCRESDPVHERHRAVLQCPVAALADHGGLWWEQVTLPAALRRGRFHIYHAPAEHGVPLFAMCPTVLTLHSATAHSYADFIRRGLLDGPLSRYVGDADPDANSLGNVYWNSQVHGADHVIAPSHFAAEEIVRLLKVAPEDVSAIPLAVDDVFRQPPTSNEQQQDALARHGIEPPYLLYVGGFEPHKNVDGLIAAFERLREHRPDLSLVLVGSRKTDRANTRVAPTVFLHGVMDDLVTLYDAAELYVSLSWRESFGLPALEAMTRGVAPVVSAWGAAPEVVGDGGLLVDPRDHAAFVDAVRTLLDDDTRAERARAAAARFDWDHAAARTLDVYRRVLGR